MCDNLDVYPKRDTIYEKFLQRVKGEKGFIECKKCLTNVGFVLLQRKDVFCRKCFSDYCCHKFRSTIGKHKAIHSGERVLVAFSGGINSSALVHMIKDGLNEDQHKRLRFIPSLLHISESIIREDSEEQNEWTLKQITDIMLETNWKCFMSSIEMSFREIETNFYTNLSENPNQRQTSIECEKRFMDSFSSLKSLTSKQEFLKRLRYRLICDIASIEGFDKIFFADNASDLAINLLSNISIGKGIQLKSESGFIDDRNEVTVLRPMREFTAKETAFYAVMKSLGFVVTKTLSTNTPLKSSIQRMTEAFVNGLQTEFPSTVYTIFKTGNKLKAFNDECNEKCIFCNSSIDTTERPKCSAFEALRLTHNLSNNLNPISDSDCESSVNDSADTHLCYSCSIISNEMIGNEEKFPKVLRKRDKNDIKDDIKEFFIH